MLLGFHLISLTCFSLQKVWIGPVDTTWTAGLRTRVLEGFSSLGSSSSCGTFKIVLVFLQTVKPVSETSGFLST